MKLISDSFNSSLNPKRVNYTYNFNRVLFYHCVIIIKESFYILKNDFYVLLHSLLF